MYLPIHRWRVTEQILRCQNNIANEEENSVKIWNSTLLKKIVTSNNK